jgi:DNA-cytosine methyltransferase
MRVLSLFDGMSCGRIALDRLGIPVEKYYASEIDKYAMQVSTANYPDIEQVGDICDLDPKDYMDVDLMLAGSPCQGFSFAGKQLAFDDPRSALFFEFIRLLKEIKPKYFLLENVRMKKEFLQAISEQVSECYPEITYGIEPIFINSSLLSAQSRQRYYWTNIPNVQQPMDKGILLKHILEPDAEEPMYSNIYGGFGEKKPRKHFDKSVTIRANSGGGSIPNVKLIGGRIVGRAYDEDGKRMDRNGDSVAGKTKQMLELRKDSKTNAITTVSKDSVVVKESKIRLKSKTVRAGGRGSYDRHEWDSVDELHWRKLSCKECERLQTVPDNYTNHVSNTQRYKMLGNGMTVDVICHIFKNME